MPPLRPAAHFRRKSSSMLSAAQAVELLFLSRRETAALENSSHHTEQKGKCSVLHYAGPSVIHRAYSLPLLLNKLSV